MVKNMVLVGYDAAAGTVPGGCPSGTSRFYDCEPFGRFGKSNFS